MKQEIDLAALIARGVYLIKATITVRCEGEMLVPKVTGKGRHQQQIANVEMCSHAAKLASVRLRSKILARFSNIPNSETSVPAHYAAALR